MPSTVPAQPCRRRQEDRGATTVEYAVAIAAIAAAILFAVFLLGDVVNEMFADSCDLFGREAGASVEC